MKSGKTENENEKEEAKTNNKKPILKKDQIEMKN